MFKGSHKKTKANVFLVPSLANWTMSGMAIVIAICIYWLLAHGQYTPRLSVEGKFYSERDGSALLVVQVPLARVSRMVQNETIRFSTQSAESPSEIVHVGRVISVTNSAVAETTSGQATRGIVIRVDPSAVTLIRYIPDRSIPVTLMLAPRRLAYLMPGGRAREPSP